MTPFRATYRVQLHRDFDLDAAADIVPYLARLSVSHLYASPIFAARPGSLHGYDVVDYNRVNPELGGGAALDRLCAKLAAAGMGLLLDIVPNHMATLAPDNAWWTDVLRHGRDSEFARTFDIDWDTPIAGLNQRVLLPILGDPYGDVLVRGEIELTFDTAARDYGIRYFQQQLPLAPASRPGGAPESVLERFNARTAEGRERLHGLLEAQHYRLAHWKTARDAINWRRFFEISDLVGVCVERPEVFEATHALVFDLYREGLVDGVRVDHVDGLANPTAYCERLRSRLTGLTRPRPRARADHPLIVVEKILASDEQLPASWPVDGTTGYDLMNQALRALIDARGEAVLAAAWRRLANGRSSFDAIETEARFQILTQNLAAEFTRLVRLLFGAAQARMAGRDFTQAAIARAVCALLQRLRVYRTYTTAGTVRPEDRATILRAADEARAILDRADHATLEALAAWLIEDDVDSAEPVRVRAARQRFEQLSAPLAAKAVEDTAFYRFGRLVAHNEVGGDPRWFAEDRAAFERAMGARAERTLNATATHDHKRGEDVRARLAVLSEIADEWTETLAGWQAAMQQHEPVPEATDTSLLFQTLVGAWPLTLPPDDEAGVTAYFERVEAWWQKAAHEAKRRTSWLAPDTDYEKALSDYIRTLRRGTTAVGPAALARWVARIAPAGAVNSLTQLLIRTTVPGIPDQYQGTELWDFSLVDPDNRGPVDFALRARLVTETPGPLLIDEWRTGALKAVLLRQLLEARARFADVFAGSFAGVPCAGGMADSLWAWERRAGARRVVAVATRRARALVEDRPHVPPPRWGDTRLELSGRWRCLLSGRALGSDLSAANVLASLPIALLTPDP